VWSTFFMAALLWKKGLLGQAWQSFKGTEQKKFARGLVLGLLSAFFIGSNWFIFNFAVQNNHLLESSLGYFINPLFIAFLGVVLLKEPIAKFQVIALVLAFLGVLSMTYAAGVFPKIALLLAGTFGLYGLVRKKSHIPPLFASLLENLFLLPVAVGIIVFSDKLHLNLNPFLWEIKQNQNDLQDFLFLFFGGAVTVFPLYWFAQALQKMDMVAIGFFQYLSPTLQFMLAVFLFGEAFSLQKAWSFALIWLAVAINFVGFVWKKRQTVNLSDTNRRIG
jgi:chloramphenicol-sensitive protein RarD